MRRLTLLLALALSTDALAQAASRVVAGYTTANLPATCTDGWLAYDKTLKVTVECTTNVWTAVASGDVSCTDCIALGSETSGNYVASVGTVLPLSGGAAGSEGAVISLSLGTVGVANGGTGATSFGAAAGAVVVSGAGGTGALGRVDAVATGQVLVSAGTATNPAWSTSPILTLVDVPEVVNGTQAGGACTGAALCLDDNVDVNGTLQCDGAFDANSTSDFAADIVLSGTADLSATGTGTSCTAGRVCINDDAEINGTLTVDTAIDTPKIYTGAATGGACTGAALCLDDNIDVNGTGQFDGVLDVNSTSDFAADIVLSGTADISANGTGTSCTAGRVCFNDDAEVNNTFTVDGTATFASTASDPDVTVSGDLSALTLKIGAGTKITKHLSTTASLDMNFSGAGVTCWTSGNIALTGAVAGDTCATNTPVGVWPALCDCFVSAADIAKIMCCDVSANNHDPGALTFRVDVWQH